MEPGASVTVSLEYFQELVAKLLITTSSITISITITTIMYYCYTVYYYDYHYYFWSTSRSSWRSRSQEAVVFLFVTILTMYTIIVSITHFITDCLLSCRLLLFPLRIIIIITITITITIIIIAIIIIIIIRCRLALSSPLGEASRPCRGLAICPIIVCYAVLVCFIRVLQ